MIFHGLGVAGRGVFSKLTRGCSQSRWTNFVSKVSLRSPECFPYEIHVGMADPQSNGWFTATASLLFVGLAGEVVVQHQRRKYELRERLHATDELFTDAALDDLFSPELDDLLEDDLLEDDLLEDDQRFEQFCDALFHGEEKAEAWID